MIWGNHSAVKLTTSKQIYEAVTLQACDPKFIRRGCWKLTFTAENWIVGYLQILWRCTVTCNALNAHRPDLRNFHCHHGQYLVRWCVCAHEQVTALLGHVTPRGGRITRGNTDYLVQTYWIGLYLWYHTEATKRSPMDRSILHLHPDQSTFAFITLPVVWPFSRQECCCFGVGDMPKGNAEYNSMPRAKSHSATARFLALNSAYRNFR
jgi:hypothetical protein